MDNYVSFGELLNKISRLTDSESNIILIGITGPSAVGKTTIVDRIKSNITTKTIAHLSFDDFLSCQYFGSNNNYKSVPRLLPEYFQVERVLQTLQSIRKTGKADYLGYIRGSGWGKQKTINKADIIIIDGLFLDSTIIAPKFNFDILIRCVAPPEIIESRRIQRDSVLNLKYGNFRKLEESKIEYKNTLASFDSYEKMEDVVILDIETDHLIFSIGGTTTNIFRNENLQVSIKTKEISSFSNLLRLAVNNIPDYYSVGGYIIVWPGRGNFKRGIVCGSVLLSKETSIDISRHFNAVNAEIGKNVELKAISIISDMQSLAWGVKKQYDKASVNNCIVINFGTGVGCSIIHNGEILERHGKSGLHYGQIGRYILVENKNKKLCFKNTIDGSIPQYNKIKFTRLTDYIRKNIESDDLGIFIGDVISLLIKEYIVGADYSIFLSGGIIALLMKKNIQVKSYLNNQVFYVEDYKRIEVTGAISAFQNNKTTFISEHI